jgi:single-strand DNA-binding protein
MNKVILMGRLTKDPEIRYTQNNTPVCNFTLAVDRRFSKDKQADFINCQAWQKTAEFISKYFQKGSMIAVVGRIQTRTWEDNEGKKRYITEVIVDEAYFTGSKSKTETDKATDTWPPDYEDDDLPF